MDIKDLHKTLNQLRVVTKYGMTAILILMTLHCGLLFFGYDLFIIHLLFWLFVLLIGYKLSTVFDLCWVHKLSVVYSMAVIFCIAFHHHRFFDTLGVSVHYFRGIMFLLGLIMIGLNIWKMRSNKC